MRTTRKLALGVALLVSAIPAASLCAAESGFRITARTDKEVYTPGETITVYLTAENPLDQIMRIVGSFSPRDRFGRDEPE